MLFLIRMKKGLIDDDYNAVERKINDLYYLSENLGGILGREVWDVFAFWQLNQDDYPHWL